LRLRTDIHRRARSFVLALAALAIAALAAPAAYAHPTVASKQAEARHVLAQVELLDRSLDQAIQAYDAATERLQQVKAELRANRHQLLVARASLRRSQARLAQRLVEMYTSSGGDSSLEVLLGSTNLDDLLSRLDAQDRVGEQDATVLRQITRFKHEIERREQKLTLARARSRPTWSTSARPRDARSRSNWYRGGSSSARSTRKSDGFRQPSKRDRRSYGVMRRPVWRSSRPPPKRKR
jgi:hypothetical protein